MTALCQLGVADAGALRQTAAGFAEGCTYSVSTGPAGAYALPLGASSVDGGV